MAGRRQKRKQSTEWKNELSQVKQETQENNLDDPKELGEDQYV